MTKIAIVGGHRRLAATALALIELEHAGAVTVVDSGHYSAQAPSLQQIPNQPQNLRKNLMPQNYHNRKHVPKQMMRRGGGRGR